MEPAIIDWNIVKSEEYVRDEVYENIDAPKWLDLSASSPPPVDDDAYFCRPDCRHPKTAENFQTRSPTPKAKPTRTKSDTMPLGERNNNNRRDGNSLKRRGGVAATLLHSSSTREPVKSKGDARKFLDDLENRNPNISSGATPGRPVKVAKEAVKSSAVRRGSEEEEEEMVNESANKKPVPKLKSTLSARNLFSGRDIMSQLSEFCNEIKRLAVGKEKPPTPAGGSEAKEEEERKVLLESSPKKNEGSVKRSCSRLTVKVLSENSSVSREVRACPPTPQRFPSPSSRRLRSTRAAAAAAADGPSSPLHKPPRSTALERGILQELDRSSEEKRTLVPKDHGNCTSTAVAPDAEGSSSSSSIDMFWFLKPCTYLV